jgi:hypothetical protein
MDTHATANAGTGLFEYFEKKHPLPISMHLASSSARTPGISWASSGTTEEKELFFVGRNGRAIEWSQGSQIYPIAALS